MKVACAPDSVAVPAGQNARFQLFNKRGVASEGEVAATMLEAIGRAGIAPDQRAWDFLSIALSVIAADESCPRSSSGDGWTRTIELTVAVSNPKAWTKHLVKLEHALGFLSTDRWKITLINAEQTGRLCQLAIRWTRQSHRRTRSESRRQLAAAGEPDCQRRQSKAERTCRASLRQSSASSAQSQCKTAVRLFRTLAKVAVHHLHCLRRSRCHKPRQV